MKTALTTRAFSVGLGFNLSPAGREPDRAEAQERALAFFDRFQQTLDKSWKRELAQWMGENTGFIQYGDHRPAVDLLPEQAVEWLLKCRHAAALEWIFLGPGHRRRQGQAGESRRRDLPVALSVVAGHMCGMKSANVVVGDSRKGGGSCRL